jgi:DNA polymerase
MPVLTIDFETYYDTDFSLSKMTTEEYIRSPRFEVIGVSVKVESEPPRWFSGNLSDTYKWLLRFPWATSIAVAHNAAFDMAILNWIFDIRPARIADTLSMARAIDGPDAGNSLAKLAERHGLGVKGNEVINALGKRRLDFSPAELARYGEYCCNDGDLTYDLFNKLATGFPLAELRTIDLTIRMFTEPVLGLDREVLEDHLGQVLDRKAKLLDGVGISSEDLMSNDKLARVIADLGVHPPTKISPTTGKEAWAFAKNDEGFKALLEHEDERVQGIVAARLGIKSTLEETRTQRFIDISKRGTLPVPLRYYAAHTGRWGGDDKINLQNLPRKSPLKKSIQAPEGFLLVDCDSSQIEARTLAWLAGQNDLVQFFERNNAEIAAGVEKADMQFDPYKIMASGIYGVPVSEVTDDQRFVGKTTILGSGYGMGAAKFQAQLKNFKVDMDLEECKRIITVYRRTYPRIVDFWSRSDMALEAMMQGMTAPLDDLGVLLVGQGNSIRLPNSLLIRYENLRKWVDPKDGKTRTIYDTKKGKSIVPKSTWGGAVTENVCQAVARIIIAGQMLKIAERYKVVMTVHDSVVAVVPKDKADEARAYIEACMRTPPPWAQGLPLNCESKMGETYGG